LYKKQEAKEKTTKIGGERFGSQEMGETQKGKLTVESYKNLVSWEGKRRAFGAYRQLGGKRDLINFQK